jgi:hypothetical protein
MKSTALGLSAGLSVVGKVSWFGLHFLLPFVAGRGNDLKGGGQ